MQARTLQDLPASLLGQHSLPDGYSKLRELFPGWAARYQNFVCC